MPPTKNLIETFRNLLADFNDADSKTDYAKIYDYLYPNGCLLLQKADDPGEFVVKDRDGVMDYLAGQEKQFPQFNPSIDPYRVQVTAKCGDPVGVISGRANYQDKYEEEKEIEIQYLFYFKQDASKNWLIWRALVIPTTLLANS